MKSKSKMTKVFVGSLVLAIALALVGGIQLGSPAWAQTTQTITLISGNGPIGTQDPANQFTLDGGVTFQDAFIIDKHSAYDLIPGTQYINRNPNFSGPASTATRYRTIFTLPSCYSNPSLSVLVHADNVATLFLNGVQIGQQPFAEIFPNFQDPADSFTVTNPALFQPGANTLEFDIFNFSGPTAFDYKAIVSFSDVCDVPIDIKPGSDPNSIKPSSQGVIPVAILTTATFDATTVDPSTVCFAGDCTEAHGTGHIEDVDFDGDLDLLLHYETSQTSIVSGDTQACLTGTTFGGQAIQGCDSVLTPDP